MPAEDQPSLLDGLAAGPEQTPPAPEPGAEGPVPRSLPAANEFSPGQLAHAGVSLRGLLGLIDERSGDRARIVEAIRAAMFSEAAASRTDEAERLGQQRARASNVLIGMKGYGLFSLEESSLTELGRALLKTASDEELRERLARHILLECHGLTVLRAVHDLKQRAERGTKAPLAAILQQEYGFRLPRATTHHTKLLQWLRYVGVLDADNGVDNDLMERLIEVRLEVAAEWAGLSPQQQAFLQTLRRMAEVTGGVEEWTKDVVRQAEREHGAIFRSDQLRAGVFTPLEREGWIAITSGGPGRGGSSGRVAPTGKLLRTDFEALTGLVQPEIPADLRPLLNTPLQKIREDLGSSDKNVKGIALELLALRMAADLGLTPLRFRERSSQTAGAEVDLIAEAGNLHFSRWLFQCKNVATSVDLADLAKEIGMAVLLKAHVVVMVTTSGFRSTVREYARSVAETTSLQVILVDKDAVSSYLSGGAGALASCFHSVAAETLRSKRGQVIA